MFKPAHARSPKLNLVRMRQDFNRKQTEKSDYTRLIEPLAWSVGVSGFGLKSCRFGVARLPEDSETCGNDSVFDGEFWDFRSKGRFWVQV